MTGASSDDGTDPQNITSSIGVLIDRQIFEALVYYNADFELTSGLAESITPDETGAVWDINLRPGLTTSAGEPFNSADVMFSLDRIRDPDSPKFAAARLADVTDVKPVDDLTVRVTIKEPDFFFPSRFTSFGMEMVPRDFDPKKPVGTGPWVLEELKPGQYATYKRNENYWQADLPKADSLAITNFESPTALLNGFQGGQLDAALNVGASQKAIASAIPGSKLVNQPGGGFAAFTMNVTKPPFDDNRVREAFKLIVDRDQLVDQVYSGEGRIANDLTSPDDDCFAADLPQRHQDLDRAEQLLKEAGVPDLTVDFVTADVTDGAVQMGEVLKEQAAGIGVTINVKKLAPTEFFGEMFSAPFAMDYWPATGVADFLAQAMLPGAGANSTGFDSDELVALFGEARGEPDAATRCDLLKQAQKVVWDEGPYVLWGYVNQLDLVTEKLQGVKKDSTGLGINAWHFEELVP
ncbi:ABC transporter substrate-binding protein [Nocardioides sp.]|uniref:ABC transporter substrate-binding protein n=1 Tax=Nocardioides sp. TaxID=35761 RepID=UPI003D1134BF